jgi:hypothetical protein
MIDHEPFLVLASKELSERLTEHERGELAAHLAECRDCRIMVAGMQRDNGRLQATRTRSPW